jgi:hypothetical protein
MKLFDKLYRITDEVKGKLNKGRIYNRMKRGFAIAKESLEEQIDNITVEIENAKIDLANGTTEAINFIIRRTVHKTELENQLNLIEDLEAEMDSEVPADPVTV